MTYQSATTASRDDLFADGGETGALMSAMDWSRSPLGAVASWPKSLRTCIRIVLTSRQPMFVWWGPQLINLYNDAYRSILGGKHPAALGQPASQVWREIWDQVGPRAETALRSTRGTYDEALLLIMERHGYQEETYYTFSYSPVPNDDGSIGGIFCANTDETRRIVDERRLAVLRDLAARTAKARSWLEACASSAAAIAQETRDIPFALVYVVDGDHSTARLAATAGIARGHPAAHESIALASGGAWHVAEALASREPRIMALADDGLPRGAWPTRPSHACAVPILPSGETGRGGVLVVGLNPFRPFDERYRDFLALVAGQMSAAIANAEAYAEERKRAEALAELDRAKTVFFSNTSHEFRTPLTLMLGPMEDVLGDRATPLAAPHRERLVIVHRNGLRLLKLVNSLLDFSRIEAGRLKASYRAVDLAALTADLASTFRSAIERAGMQLRVDCPPLPAEVYVDPDLWEKVVLNLLSNAFKHTFAGSIAVSLRQAAGAVELSVADTGIGIPPDQLPRLFERFHRVQGARSRSHEGTGIGLALVQELAKLHGGAVAVRSEVDRGSTFTVTIPLGSAHLPRDQVAATAAPATPSTRATAFLEEALRWLPEAADAGADETAADGAALDVAGEPGGHVLLADDNADMRAYVRRILGRRWHVETTADGAQALAAARSRTPDLILSDVMMPTLDGFGLLREVRRDPVLRHVPVILLSARAGEEAGIEGLEAGADDYLVKPFSAQELMARVAAHLQLKRQRDLSAREARQQERLLRFVTENARIGLVLIDKQHRYLFANSAYSEILGVPPGDIVGRRIADVLPPVYDREIKPRLERAFAGEHVEYELSHAPDATGVQRSYAVTYDPRLDVASGPCVVVVVVDITERKRIEASLRQSERALHLAIDSARMVAWSYDPHDGRIASAGDVGGIFGLGPDDRVDRMDVRLALMHPDDAPRHRSTIESAISDRKPYQSIFRLRRPLDGRLAWMEEHGEPHERDGGIVLFGVTADVTVRVEAEQAIRRSEERFRGIVDQSLAGIAERDADGRITTANDRYCALTGYAREDLTGRSVFDITAPEDRQRLRAAFDELAHSRKPFDIEKRYIRPDGSAIWVNTSVSGVFDGDGRLLRTIAVSVDISERKRAEEALRYRTQQFEALLNQAPVGVYVVDADFRLRDVNPVAWKSFEGIDGGVIGRDFDEFVHVIWPRERADAIVVLFRSVLATGEPYIAPEWIDRRHDRGVVEAYAWRLDRITLPDGRFGVVAYFTDILPQVQAREALAQHAEELRRANVELEQFAYIASHDLQEPLRMVTSYADLVVRRYGPALDDRGRDFLARISSGVGRMQSLILALLSYTQVGRSPLNRERFALADVLGEVVEVLLERIDEKHARIEIGWLPEISADRTRIAQLLQNLVGNALKFTPAGRLPVVRVDGRDEGSEWRIAVADNGIGIPDDARGKLFQIFQRLHRADEYPGSGIGLVTCKRIVEQHGGGIGFESVLGEGTTFWFTIPKDSPETVR